MSNASPTVPIDDLQALAATRPIAPRFAVLTVTALIILAAACAAHAGGAVAGAALGRVLLCRWQEARPGWCARAAGVCVAGVLGVGWAGTVMAQSNDADTLIPNSELPRSPPRDVADALARSAELIRKYPHDPRARLDRGLALLISMDVTGAERELRAGLAEEKALARLNPAVGSLLRATLAKVLVVQSRRDEATAMARPLCETESSFRAEVAKVGLCPNLAPTGRRAPGELDPARITAVLKAADQLTALAHRPPHLSDPAAGALLDTVLDVADLTREVPLITQMASIGLWATSIGNVCAMYELPAAPDAARERMRDYAAELGRCADASLGAIGAVLVAMADPPAEFRGLQMSMKPNPRELVMPVVVGVLATMKSPEPTDAWRRARLPALAALADRAGPLLTAEERRQLAASVLAAARAASDPEVRTGLMSIASRFGGK
jgi:hypothetical protein